MHKLIDLTEHYKQCLMDLAKGIGGYEGVNKLELLKRSE
jgi:flagellar assembly factor FliW